MMMTEYGVNPDYSPLRRLQDNTTQYLTPITDLVAVFDICETIYYPDIYIKKKLIKKQI